MFYWFESSPTRSVGGVRRGRRGVRLRAGAFAGQLLPGHENAQCRASGRFGACPTSRGGRRVSTAGGACSPHQRHGGATVGVT
jgi:hypothetical protein